MTTAGVAVVAHSDPPPRSSTSQHQLAVAVDAPTTPVTHKALEPQTTQSGETAPPARAPTTPVPTPPDSSEAATATGHKQILATVKDQQGRPLSGICVRAVISPTPDNYFAGITGDNGTTTFGVPDLPGVNVTVEDCSSQAPGYASVLAFVPLSANGPTTFEVALLPGSGLVGTVVDSSGRPLSGVTVMSDNTPWLVQATTDNAGHYQLRGAHPGWDNIYVVERHCAQDVQLTANETLTLDLVCA